MNALRTEDDLRDALDQLSSGAPTVDAVLPRAARPRRKLAWMAPLAAALIAVAVAVVIVIVINRGSHRSPAAGPPPAQLVGSWRLVSAGPDLVSSRESLHIKAHGRFWADVEPCDSVHANLQISGSTWHTNAPRTEFRGWCPPAPMSRAQARRSDAIANDVRHMFTKGEITWSLTVDRLTLRRPGVPTLVYFRVDRPHTLPAH